MTSLSASSSSSRGSGPGTKLVLGAVLIALVGLAGLAPLPDQNWTSVWPHAALWGAVGWGASGISVRIIVLLAAFGIAQDIAYTALLGTHTLTNLSIYALSTQIRVRPALTDGLLGGVATVFGLFAAGSAILWTLASLSSGQAAEVSPFVWTLLVTAVAYLVVRRLFDLGTRPGAVRRDRS